MVKSSPSKPHAYYLGDLPGNLQYSKDVEDIMNTELPDDEDTLGFVFCEHSVENLRRLTPLSRSKVNWKILLIIKRENEFGETWLKAALQDKDTGKIALLSSTNDKENITRKGNRPVKTVDGTWAVGHYRMLAPMFFWKELRNRLLY
jgi:hypothetical protein